MLLWGLFVVSSYYATEVKDSFLNVISFKYFAEEVVTWSHQDIDFKSIFSFQHMLFWPFGKLRSYCKMELNLDRLFSRSIQDQCDR